MGVYNTKITASNLNNWITRMNALITNHRPYATNKTIGISSVSAGSIIQKTLINQLLNYNMLLSDGSQNTIGGIGAGDIIIDDILGDKIEAAIKSWEQKTVYEAMLYPCVFVYASRTTEGYMSYTDELYTWAPNIEGNNYIFPISIVPNADKSPKNSYCCMVVFTIELAMKYFFGPNNSFEGTESNFFPIPNVSGMGDIVIEYSSNIRNYNTNSTQLYLNCYNYTQDKDTFKRSVLDFTSKKLNMTAGKDTLPLGYNVYILSTKEANKNINAYDLFNDNDFNIEYGFHPNINPYPVTIRWNNVAAIGFKQYSYW